MKLVIEVEAPFTSRTRKGWLVYGETGRNLEGFINDSRGAGLFTLWRFYQQGTYVMLASLKITGGQWQQFRESTITTPGETL